jgi:uncharacterized protein YbjT (DUF2867 family)
MNTTHKPTLVIGGNGRIGRRIVDRLRALDRPVRIGSPSGQPSFDWQDPTTWKPALAGTEAAYVMYHPEIELPESAPAIAALGELAVECGVRRLVLLSAIGVRVAEDAEDAIRKLPLDWTILAARAFNQNFDEGVFADPLRAGVLDLPIGTDVTEAFVDAEDIAEVAVAALTEDGHVGRRYELSGPRLLTFGEAVAEMARAAGREMRYVEVGKDEFVAGLVDNAGLPAEEAAFLGEVVTSFFDGSHSHIYDGVEQALGRKPRDFSDFAHDAAATGVWNAPG